MNLLSYFREAFANLLASKLRSFLAVLGVLVGTASVVALVSTGELATDHALAQFQKLGTNLLSVSISTDSGGEQKNPVTLSDVSTLQISVPEIELAAPYTNVYVPVSYEGHSFDNANIIGADRALSDVVKIELARGRFVTYLDKNEFFAVIGDDVAKSLKKYGVANPIGAQIRTGSEYFTVVGVLKPWPQNMFMYADINHALIVPIPTTKLLSKYAQINNIIFRVKPNINIDKTQAKIVNMLNQLSPGKRIFPRSAKRIIESRARAHQTFTLLLGAIGGIALLVGGIGVMNIMLVAVTERRREIGIRMAIGARGRDIQIMFLMEGIALTLFGGVMGVITGVVASFAVAGVAHWGFHLFWMPPLIGFSVSVFTGIFFGYYPAYKASRLDPIETLRSE